MTTLTIEVTPTGILAVEKEYGEDVKYVESFDTWADLLNTLGVIMPYYAWITITN